MKTRLFVTAVALGLAPPQGHADETCAWAGGEYAFKEHGIYGDFTVNENCTEIVWSRLSDGPETATLERSKDGWKGELKNADVELLEDGRHLRITAHGGARRQTNAERKN